MAKENTTKYIILGLLKHEDMSGYDIKKRIDIGISQFWNVGYGQIYPTLSTLEQEGMVKKSVSDAIHGTQKHLYAITDAGRQALQSWLMLPDEREYTRYEIALKLFFSAGLPVEQSIDRLDCFAQRHEQNLRMIQLFKQELSQIRDDGDDHLYYYLTVLLGEHIYGAYLAWARQAKQLLAGADGNPGAKEK